MYTPRHMQGQIVEVSFLWSPGGWVYQRVYDRSDRSTSWYRAEPDWDREGEGIDYDREPYVIGEWVECDEPHDETLHDVMQGRR